MCGLCSLIAIQGSTLQAIWTRMTYFCYVHIYWTCPGIYPQDHGYSLRTHPAASGHVQGYIHKTMDIASGHIQWPLDTSRDISIRLWIQPLDTSSGLWTCPGICPQEHEYVHQDISRASGHVQGYIHMDIAFGHVQRPLDTSRDISTRAWICPHQLIDIYGYVQVDMSSGLDMSLFNGYVLLQPHYIHHFYYIWNIVDKGQLHQHLYCYSGIYLAVQSLNGKRNIINDAQIKIEWRWQAT